MKSQSYKTILNLHRGHFKLIRINEVWPVLTYGPTLGNGQFGNKEIGHYFLGTKFKAAPLMQCLLPVVCLGPSSKTCPK